MEGIAEGLAAGYGISEGRKRREFDEKMRLAAEQRAAETHALSQRQLGAQVEGLERTQRLNTEYDAAIGAGQAAGPAARMGDVGDYGDSDYGTSFGAVGMAAPGAPARAKLNAGAINDAALRAGKITPEQWEAGQQRERAKQFKSNIGARVKQLMEADDETMAGLVQQFSSDEDSFGTGHWVAGGAKGAKPGDPNPRTGKGGYAYLMVGNREPFKLNRAEIAQVAAAYQIMREDPDNYDMAFDVFDKGTSKMRELAKAFREESMKLTEQNNKATQAANADEVARGNLGINSARLGLERDRMQMSRFGAPMQAVGPNGQPTMLVPVTSPQGVSFQAGGLPEGYRLPKQVDPNTIRAMAESMVGQPSGQLQNGRPVPHTYESAWASASDMLYGRQAGAGPDVGRDAAAIQDLLARRRPGAAAQPTQAQPMPARSLGDTSVFANMPDAELMRYVQAGNAVARQAMAERRAAASAPVNIPRGLDPGY